MTMIMMMRLIIVSYDYGDVNNCHNDDDDDNDGEDDDEGDNYQL